jgi:TonB family protein
MIGETLRGYRVVEELGAGGMGMVFVGEHEFIGKRAAIKVLLPELSQDASIVRRFFNEAKAATQVRHPGIVEVFDFGYHTDGRAFIVMELLDGESLASRLKRTGRIPIPVCIRLLSQIGGALGAAHAVGIVHRDLKPDNIFIVRDPDITGGERAKVLDFGIAKLAGDMSAEGLKTRTGSIIGTPRYMAPEQCRGSQVVDHRADLYALGCIAYEMMCGRPPFLEQGIGDLFAAHMFAVPPQPSTIEPSISPVIESAILCLLAKNPNERFPSAEAFVQVLNSADSGHASTMPAPVVHAAWSGQQIRQSTTLSESVATLKQVRPKAPRRSRWPWSVALGFVLIGGASAAIVLSKNEQMASPQVAPPEVLSTQANPGAETVAQELASIATATGKDEDTPESGPGQAEEITPGGGIPTGRPANIESPTQPAPSKISAGRAVAAPVATAQPVQRQVDAPAVRPGVPQQQAVGQGAPNAAISHGPARSGVSTAAVTLPPKTSGSGDMINKGNSTLPEYPNRSDVAKGVDGVRDQVTECGKKHPGAGEVRITVVVEPSGSVATAWLKSTPNEHLGRCVAEAIKQAKFPPSQKGTKFTYPFVFGGSNAVPERPSRNDIRDAIGAVRPRIVDCNKKYPGSGEVKVTMVVEPSGAIGSTSVRSTADNDLLATCVAEVMKQAKFPKSQKGETFTYPFVF